MHRDLFITWLGKNYPHFNITGVQYRYVEAYLSRDNKAKFQWPYPSGKPLITSLLEEYEKQLLTEK